MEQHKGDSPMDEERQMEKLLVEFPGIDLNLTSKSIVIQEGITIEDFRKSFNHLPQLDESQAEVVKEAEQHIATLQELCVSITEAIEQCKSKLTDMLKECIESLENHKKILLTRQQQLSMAIYLHESAQTGDFKTNYSKLFESLGKFRVPVESINLPLNLRILKDLYEKERTYFKQYKTSMKELLTVLKAKQPDERLVYQHFRNCKITVQVKLAQISKVFTIVDIYSYACVLPGEDLFSLDPNKHKRWDKLRSVMSVRFLGNSEVVHASFNEPREGLNVASAMLSKIAEINQKCDFSKPSSKNFVEIIKGGWAMATYGFSKDKARKRAEASVANPTSQAAISLWNLPETGVIKNIVEMGLPSIMYSEVVYLPRHFPPISEQLVGNWNRDRNFGISKDEVKFNTPIEDLPDYVKKLFTVNGDRMLVRINSPYFLEKNEKSVLSFSDKVSKVFKKTSTSMETIIFHIHGGGFVSQSSFVHQMYVRKWANTIGVPVFSVDYRKAPVYPYPNGLDDCYQTYMWLLYYLEQIFNVTPKKIILTGDSAGGNLVAALTCLLIKQGLRVPDGIVLTYPALNLNYNNYTPSLLSSLDEPILPHTYLKICLQSYIQNEQLRPELDPFLSPIRSSDEILNKFPPTRIFVGNADPFHDDCCRLAERLAELNKDVKLTVYDTFPHGFLQFDNPPKGHKYCATAIDEVRDALGELIKMK